MGTAREFFGYSVEEQDAWCDALEDTCPTCGSTAPHQHPAVQHEGEVEICANAYHLQPTPQNKPEYVAAVLAKRSTR